MMEIVGTTTNWDGLEKAKEERWEKVGHNTFHCKLHNTYFNPDGYAENDFQDAEPCWQCFSEFEIRL